MLLKRTGYPQEEELVYCTVTNVQPHSVFCKLEEYGSSGMIHISEVSPGRIRNIRDFVKEGKIVVCKVLRINTDRGHIDLSLRRVSDNQRRVKINQIKQEQKAEKIVESIAKDINMEAKDVYAKLAPKIFETYDYLFTAFMDVVNGKTTFAQLGLPKDLANTVQEVITTRLKPDEVSVSGMLRLMSFKPDGVNEVKNALKKAISAGAKVLYISGGTYRLSVKAPDYKSAEKIMEKASKEALNVIEKSGGIGSFEEVEK